MKKFRRLARTPLLVALLGSALFAATPSAAQEALSAFDVPQVVLGPYDPQFDATLDFDGDGDVDALGMRVYAYSNHTYLALYENDGQGVFASAWQTTIILPGVDLANPIVVGDFDDDGLDDFAIGIGTLVFAFRSNGPAPPTALPPLSTPSALEVLDLAAGDFNGDGRDDLAALYTAHLTVFESLPTWPDPSPATVALGGGTTPVEIVAAQLTGLGPADVALVTASPSSMELYSMDGGTPVLFHSSATGLGAQALLAAGDLDGDGDDDVVAFAAPNGGAQFRIWRQGPPGQFTLEPIQSGGPATDLADIDGDGDLDGICCGGGGGPPAQAANHTISTFELALNDGTGHFDPAFRLQGLGANRIAGAADLDGDGDADLIAGRVVHFSRGPLVRSPAPNHLNYSPLYVGTVDQDRCVDSDHDGDPDLAVSAIGRLKNRGEGSMTALPTLVIGAPGVYLHHRGRAGDWDGDGDVDLIVDWYPQPLMLQHQLVRNLGGGTFEWGPEATSAPMATTSVYRSIAADLDDDGDLDLLSTNDFSAAVSGGFGAEIWLNDGAGFFTFATNVPNTVKAVVDLDGDTLLDLVVASTTFGWMKNLGSATFAAAAWFGGIASVDNWHDDPAIGDLDGDGDLDLALISFNAELIVVRNDGGGVFTTVPGLVPAPAVHLDTFGQYTVRALHVDDDGFLDLLTFPAPYALNAAAIYRTNGQGLSYTAPVVQNLIPEILADFDGDGDVDLASAIYTYPNLRYEMPEAGRREQKGVVTPGTSGLAPTLGASGPFRIGETVTLRATGAVGGAPGILAIGVAPAEMSNFPFPGMTTYVDVFAPGTLLLPVIAAGAPGQPGKGSFVLSVTIPPVVLGADLYHQAFFLDLGAPSLFSSTELLHLHYGQ